MVRIMHQSCSRGQSLKAKTSTLKAKTEAKAWTFEAKASKHSARGEINRVPTLYEELNYLTFPDHARDFSLTKLTYNSYVSLHSSRLLLPYTDSLCYHYHILNH